MNQVPVNQEAGRSRIGVKCQVSSVELEPKVSDLKTWFLVTPDTRTRGEGRE